MRPIFFTANNNVRVRITEQTMQHMAAHPIENALLGEAIALAKPADVRSWAGHVDLGRLVGVEDRVVVDPVDIDQPTLFARRQNRNRPTHTALFIEPKPVSTITLVINRFGYDSRTLVSAWFGTLAKPEPRGLQAKEHLEYWCNNALIWNNRNFIELPFKSTWRKVLTDNWQEDAKL